MTSLPSLGSRLKRARCLVLVSGLLLGCAQRPESTFSFYEARIAPIFDVGCARQTTGCHVDDGKGVALGNLDLSSYDTLSRRNDLLAPFGPYPLPLLLLKAGNPAQIDVRTIDPPDPTQPDKRRVSITTDIRHAAGEGAISQGSRDYSILKQWLDGGHTRTGVPQQVLRTSSGACSHTLIPRAYIDTQSAPQDPEAYLRFVRDVAPILEKRCAGGYCHGSSTADLYLTCGESEPEQRWNYELARRYLDEEPASSELLRRPLAKSAGGVFHEGGDIFAAVSDADYRTILSWAELVVTNEPDLLAWGATDDGLRFFGNRVQPMLVRKGCMFLNCHSPSMFHDLRLRGGSRGFFSEIATRRNYEMSRAMLATDSEDPGQSRLLAKNLCPVSSGGHGIQHRGGALFEDFGGCASSDTRASPAQCAGVDADAGDLDSVPAYCVLARWHAIERAQAIARTELPAAAAPSGVVFVLRPEGVGSGADFDTFRPGADLIWADAQQDAQAALQLGATHSLLAACGLSGSLDVRGPALSWDAKLLAFAVRRSAGEPLQIYQMHSDGSACAQLSALNAASSEQDGILVHDFDPTYAPDGRLVFASTRGNIAGGASARGPTRTPATLAPNANLYVFEPDATPVVRQLTFLSNQEFAPSFMSDGRVIFSVEKRALDFHQFAARRQNLDGGDYHPLIAQRPSIGFDSATELVELTNRNFALVMANLDAADGGGSIAIVNRSIGPDQDDRDPSDRAYVHSVTPAAPGAFGGATGVYRSPAPLPSGRLLVACDLAATDAALGPHHYGLCELDPSTPSATPRQLFRDGARVALEPAPVWVRAARTVFVSRADEVNGSTRVDPGQTDATVHFMDLPLLQTLMFSNTRVGRPINAAVRGVELFEARPPPATAHNFSDLTSNVVSDAFGPFYQDLRSLGRAPLASDGALRIRLPGGMPVSLSLLDADDKTLMFGTGAPFTGPMRQREEMQFYPGERLKQSMPRRLFNGVCAGCHGSISGRELDAVVDVDVLGSASVTLADDAPVDLR
jgi:WD40-like Beta Propeller Repeat